MMISVKIDICLSGCSRPLGMESVVYAAVAVVLDRADARALFRRRLVEEKQ